MVENHRASSQVFKEHRGLTSNEKILVKRPTRDLNNVLFLPKISSIDNTHIRALDVAFSVVKTRGLNLDDYQIIILDEEASLGIIFFDKRAKDPFDSSDMPGFEVTVSKDTFECIRSISIR